MLFLPRQLQCPGVYSLFSAYSMFGSLRSLNSFQKYLSKICLFFISIHCFYLWVIRNKQIRNIKVEQSRGYRENRQITSRKITKHMNSFVHHTFRKVQIILGEFRSDQQKISGFKKESYQETSEKPMPEVAARKKACGIWGSEMKRKHMLFLSYPFYYINSLPFIRDKEIQFLSIYVILPYPYLLFIAPCMTVTF